MAMSLMSHTQFLRCQPEFGSCSDNLSWSVDAGTRSANRVAEAVVTA
jgi:hypothetical protein